MKRCYSSLILVCACLCLLLPSRLVQADSSVSCRFSWDSNPSLKIKRGHIDTKAGISASELSLVTKGKPVRARVSDDQASKCKLAHPKSRAINKTIEKKLYNISRCGQLSAKVYCRRLETKDKPASSTKKAQPPHSKQHVTRRHEKTPSRHPVNKPTRQEPRVQPNKNTTRSTPSRAKPPFPASKAATTSGRYTSPSIDSFLATVRQSSSLDEIAKAYKNTSLTESDRKRLEYELKRPSYAQKLSRLKADTRVPTKGLNRVDIQRITQNKNQSLALSQNKELEQLNAEARLALSRMESHRDAAPASNMTDSESSRELTASMQAAIDSPHAESQAQIYSITPYTATVGRNITIRGNGFEDSRGNIYIIIDDDVTYFHEIVSWSNTEIVATVPRWGYYELPSGRWVTGIKYLESEKPAIIWIQPGRRNIGPTRNVRIKPDQSDITPTITSLSSLDIHQNQQVNIWGTGFLKEKTGTVTFYYPHGHATAHINGTILDWENTSVAVVFPLYLREAMSYGGGKVKLTNHAGLSVEHAVNYTPTTEIIHLTASNSVDSPGLVGHEEEFGDHQFYLKNGWEVEDHRLSYSGNGLGWGAVYSEWPRGGSRLRPGLISFLTALMITTFG